MSEEIPSIEVPSNPELVEKLIDAAVDAIRLRIFLSEGEPGDELGMTALSEKFKTQLEDFGTLLIERAPQLIEDRLAEPHESSKALSSAPDAGLTTHGKFIAKKRSRHALAGIKHGRIARLRWHHWDRSGSTPVADGLDGIDTTLPWELEWADLPFCAGGRLWHLWIPGIAAGGPAPAMRVDQDAFALSIDLDVGESRVEYLDWSNTQIYDLGDEGLLQVTDDPCAYIRFFFHLVHGVMGRFFILEEAMDLARSLPWKPGAGDAEERGKVTEHVHPIQLKGTTTEDGELVFDATVLFKNALFTTDVLLAPNGVLTLVNEELRIDALNIYELDDLSDGLSESAKSDGTDT